MRRSIPALLAGFALLAPAAAAAKTTHFTGTAKVRAIEGSTLAGTTTSSLGKGATVYVTKAGPNNTVLATFTIFATKGTLTGTSSVTQTPGANGAPTTLTGTAKIKGGTGAYKGAKGSFSVTGTITSDGLVTLKVSDGKFTTP